MEGGILPKSIARPLLITLRGNPPVPRLRMGGVGPVGLFFYTQFVYLLYILWFVIITNETPGRYSGRSTTQVVDPVEYEGD